jgi:parvulin-like peptidyl-prolyl isomerase
MASRCLGFGMVLTGALVLVAGCGTAGPVVLPTSSDKPLNLAAVDPGEPVVARSQKPEPDHPAPAQPEPSQPAPLPRPPTVPLPTPASDHGSGPMPDLRNRLSVRALVNGKPIFDNEVLGGVARLLGGIGDLPESQRAAALTKAFNDELNQIIERELIYQDALRKLAQNPKFLDQLKKNAAKDFDKKRAGQARSLKLTIEQLKRLVNTQLGKGGWESLRRQEERNYIVFEYVRSRVFPYVSQVSHEDIYEYYKQHLSEFCTVDRVQWQDIFIPVGPNHPNMADARQFSEQILERVRQGQPFDEFLRFDEGDSWSYRKGEGNGQLRGEIRPPELEPYLLRMKQGEVGPAVELSTGVHVFRVLKRDHAGQLPFNEDVQTRIGTRLKNAIADRQYKRIVKELREHAVIDIIRGNPFSP